MAVIELNNSTRCRLDLSMQTPAATLFEACAGLMTVYDHSKATGKEVVVLYSALGDYRYSLSLP